MSFRARLTTFFVLIVVIPLVAMGVLVFGLIDGSASSRADSRAAGIAQTAASLYRSESRTASLDARTVARRLARTPAARLPAGARALVQNDSGLARIEVIRAGGAILSVGARTAVASGVAVVLAVPGRPALTVAVSELAASDYAHQLAGAGTALVVRSGTTTLASTLPGVGHRGLPAAHGTVRLAGARYRVVTQRVVGFILGFLLLAFGFTLLASHGLASQVSHFLEAARRLGGGDFSRPCPPLGTTSSRRLATSSTRCPRSCDTASTSSSRSAPASAPRSTASARRSPRALTARRCSISRCAPRSTPCRPTVAG